MIYGDIQLPGTTFLTRLKLMNSRDVKWFHRFCHRHNIQPIKIDEADFQKREKLARVKKKMRKQGRIGMHQILDLHDTYPQPRHYYWTPKLLKEVKDQLLRHYTWDLDVIPKGKGKGTTSCVQYEDYEENGEKKFRRAFRCPYWSSTGRPGPSFICRCSFLHRTNRWHDIDLIWDEIKSCGVHYGYDD